LRFGVVPKWSMAMAALFAEGIRSSGFTGRSCITPNVNTNCGQSASAENARCNAAHFCSVTFSHMKHLAMAPNESGAERAGYASRKIISRPPAARSRTLNMVVIGPNPQLRG